MTILFVVSHRQTAFAFKGLTDACKRARIEFNCFFTGDGVNQLEDAEVVTLANSASQSIVCEHSWDKSFPAKEPPVEKGSQTDHSRMVATAHRVVSL